jgi:hypothetical protein
VSDPFYRPPAQRPIFHGRVSTNRGDKGFDNYLALTVNDYRVRIFFNGDEHPAVTADPEAGIIETYQADRMVTLKGRVEIRLERKAAFKRALA